MQKNHELAVVDAAGKKFYGDAFKTVVANLVRSNVALPVDDWPGYFVGNASGSCLSSRRGSAARAGDGGGKVDLEVLEALLE